MFSGYWIVPWKSLPRLPIKPEKTLSILALLLAARNKEKLPFSLLVPGLDMLLGLSDDIQGMTAYLRSILSTAPTNLWRSTVIIMPVEAINLNEEWKIKISFKDEAVAVKWIFPRAELQVIGDLSLCYSPIVVIS